MITAAELASMQAEAAKMLLDQTCTIKRGVATQDQYGVSSTPYSAIATDVACNLAQPNKSYLSNYAERIAGQTAWQVSFAYGQDVQEGDQLDINGSTLVVQAVNQDPEFKESFQILVSVLASEVG